MGRKGRDVCRFPAARIKKIMRTDDEVGKITQATPILVSCALELFLKSLVGECVNEARARSGKKISASHLKAAINNNEKFDFLKDLVANVPDPVDNEEDADADDGKKKKRKRVTRTKKGAADEGGGEDNLKEEYGGVDMKEETGAPEEAIGRRVRRKASIQSLLLDEDAE